MGRSRWRAAAATWGSAAWLVLRQFGVPAASRPERTYDIVRVQEAGESLTASERLPDGRILTVPVPACGEPRQDAPDAPFRFSPN
jgi:hypothetical protein